MARGSNTSRTTRQSPKRRRGPPRPAWHEVVSIYFVAAEHIGAIKIGQSTNVPNRIRHLQETCPDTLRLLGLLPATATETATETQILYRESDIHRRFIDLWLRGEWFAAEQPLTTFIAAHALAPEPYYRRLIGDEADVFLAANADVLAVPEDVLGPEWIVPVVRRTRSAR